MGIAFSPREPAGSWVLKRKREKQIDDSAVVQHYVILFGINDVHRVLRAF
jgi:hypothetical protein